MVRAFDHPVATCCDMLAVVGSSPGQTIATSQRNISLQCWPNICKLQTNDRNISMQQIATLLGATCCTRLTTLLQLVATCCELKIKLVRMPRPNIAARTWPNGYNIMQHSQMLHEKFDLFLKIFHFTEPIYCFRIKFAEIWLSELRPRSTHH